MFIFKVLSSLVKGALYLLLLSFTLGHKFVVKICRRFAVYLLYIMPILSTQEKNFVNDTHATSVIRVMLVNDSVPVLSCF